MAVQVIIKFYYCQSMDWLDCSCEFPSMLFSKLGYFPMKCALCLYIVVWPHLRLLASVLTCIVVSRKMELWYTCWYSHEDRPGMLLSVGVFGILIIDWATPHNSVEVYWYYTVCVELCDAWVMAMWSVHGTPAFTGKTTCGECWYLGHSLAH